MATQRVLVVANQTAVGPHLTQLLYDLKGNDDLSVFVVVPATRPPFLSGSDDVSTSDVSGTRRANRQLSAAIRTIQNIGATARGVVGPSDPMQAVLTAFAEQAFDCIVVSTLPIGLSKWLAMDLPHRLERRFKLPVHHVVGQAIAEPKPARSIETPVRVLLVEDQPADVVLCDRALDASEEAVELQVAKNGAEALDALRTNGTESVDLILIDLNVPVLGGHEFLERAMSEFEPSELNVIILSTSSSETDRERAHALGAAAYLLKEPDFDRFAATLCSVVAEVSAGWRFNC